MHGHTSMPISPPVESENQRKRTAEELNDPSVPRDSERKRVKRVKPRSPASDVPELPIVNLSSQYMDSDHTQSLGFSAGAVIAMRLVDFQVSRDATYRFGPYLNMILGSNGSGKSTVITAVFLLFQGRIRDLERTTHGEFVTFGKDRAVLSAVLQSRSIYKKPNHVVAMVIPASKQGGRPLLPQWYLDGSAVSESEFAQFIASYHIQVNNLSQFLPQSRIASFASLSPEERLKSIEEAVGYDGMLDDHKLLSSRGQELVQIEREIDLYHKRLGDLHSRQSELEEKLNQLGSVREEKGHLKYLNNVLKIAEYHAIEGEMNEIRDALDKARNDLRNFDTEHTGVQGEIDLAATQITELEAAHKQSDLTLHEVEKVYDAQQKHAHAAREKLQSLVKERRDLQREHDAFARKLEQVERDHRESTDNIARSRKALNSMGDTESFTLQARELNSLQQSLNDVQTKRREIFNVEEQTRVSLDVLKRNLEKSQIKLRTYENAQTRGRLGSVRKVFRWDNGKLERAVEFVRSHRGAFKMPVIEPAIISVDITDERLVSMIASVVPLQSMFKFICQCREDMSTLSRLVAGSDVDVKSLLNERKSALPDKVLPALKEAGFDGVLSEALSGPKPMVEYLSSLALGATPYSLKASSESSRHELKASYPQIQGFIDPQMHYSFMTSRYGRRMETETSVKIGTTPPWVKFMLRRDTSKEEARLKDEQKKLRADLEREYVKLEEVQERLKDVKAQESVIQSKYVDKQSLVKAFERHKTRLKIAMQKEQQLSNESKKLKTGQREKLARSKELINDLQTGINEVTKQALSVEDLKVLLLDAQKRTLANLQIKDLVNKKCLLSEALKKLRKQCQSAVVELETKLSTRQRETRDQHRDAEEAISWLRAHKRLQAGVKKAHEVPVPDLQAEIGRRQSLLDMRDAQGESYAVVKQKLNNVVTEIHDLEQKLITVTTMKENVSSEIDSTRTKWESELEKMVQSSSSAFSKMFLQLSCRGSVSISKPDPLAVGTWGLDVNVAFREHEQEQKLSRNRQSGGERSVTTAVYLMSLQSMAQAPFRVLDEINQGMDKQNETKTMAFLVNISCNAQGLAQQYFVITPKLLFNMPYHRRMSMNFIISSDQIQTPEALLPPTMDQNVLESLIEEEALSE